MYKRQIFRSGGFSRSDKERLQVDEIANNHLIKGKNTALSSRAGSICYYIQGFCNATKRDFNTALLKFQRTKNILDSNPLIKNDLPWRYVRTMGNIINCHIESNNLIKAQELLVELNELNDQKNFKSLDIKVKLFTIYNDAQLAIFEKKGDFQKALRHIDNLELGFSTLKNKLNKD